MKKTMILLAGCLMISAVVTAQSVQEGINHLYAERYQSAKATFEKLVSVNPNNIDATYWLGQAELALENTSAARTLYENALLSNRNAPLFLVGMGNVELVENKLAEARQNFETAITISRSRKGNDPNILNAIGRAHANAKNGDHAYAIATLKAAAERDAKSPDIYLNLGNAYRKAIDGSNAVVSYENALQINPNFAIAYYKMAKIYKTQQNWEIFERDLKAAVSKDTAFAPAYFELFHFNFVNQNYKEAENYLNKSILHADKDVQNEYWYSQLLYKKKRYDEAIEKINYVLNSLGSKAKPRAYMLMAYCYFEKADYINADKYFAKVDPANIITMDYKLKADILSKKGAGDDDIINVYVKGASLDTIESSRIAFLNKGVEYFSNAGKKVKEAEMRLLIFKNKKNPSPHEYHPIGMTFYQGQEYFKADSLFNLYSNAYPDSIFGYLWSARSLAAIDTTMELGLAIPAYEKTLQISTTDMVRYKGSGIEACGNLASYYNNVKADKEKAIFYLKKGLEFDPENESLLQNLQILETPSLKPVPKGTKSRGT